MLHELEPTAFGAVRGLFLPLAHHLNCAAAVEGIRPGRIWVDDPDEPRAAFLASTTLYYLAGTPTDGFRRDLNRLITGEIFRRDPLGGKRKAVRLICHPDAWDDEIDAVFEGWAPIRTRRRFYTYDLSREPQVFPVPDSCELRTLSAGILADPAIEVHRLVLNAIRFGGGTVEEYLEHNFMCVAVLDGKTVSWAPVNVIVGRRCDLGISTEAAYRRRGLAVATTAGGLRLAKARGMTTATWHCDERNPGSVRVAERAGFSFDREYPLYLVVGDEKIHAEQIARWEKGLMV